MGSRWTPSIPVIIQDLNSRSFLWKNTYKEPGRAKEVIERNIYIYKKKEEIGLFILIEPFDSNG